MNANGQSALTEKLKFELTQKFVKLIIIRDLSYGKVILVHLKFSKVHFGYSVFNVTRDWLKHDHAKNCNGH